MRARFAAAAGIALFGLALSVGPAAAQDATDTGWQVESKVSLSLTQSSFNTAWAGDEVGTLSWIATWNSTASKSLAPWAHWKNRLLLQFGQTHQQDSNREGWLAPSKSSDKILYRGEMLFPFDEAFTLFDPFVSFDVDSQFFTELPAVGTRTFTPTVFTESAGIARNFSDTEHRKLDSRLGFALKQRVDRLALDSTTNQFGSETTVEGGFEWFSTAQFADREERAVYGMELRVFKAVATSESDPVKRLYWPAVDVDWQNTLTSKVTKWLSFDLFWQLLYDKQINQTGQFKQTLGFGLTWQLVS